MIKLVLFDADGVTINGEPFSKELTRKYNIPPESTLKFFKGIFKDTKTNHADLREVIAPFLKEWGWVKSIDEFLDEWFKYEHQQINQELINYISALRKKGVSVALATNQEKYRAQYILEKMGFGKIFDRTYFSAHLGLKKPDAAFFRKITEDWPQIQKDEVLFWDDMEENILAAREFGWNAEVYKDFEDFKEKMNHYLSIFLN